MNVTDEERTNTCKGYGGYQAVRNAVGCIDGSKNEGKRGIPVDPGLHVIHLVDELGYPKRMASFHRGGIPQRLMRRLNLNDPPACSSRGTQVHSA